MSENSRKVYRTDGTEEVRRTFIKSVSFVDVINYKLDLEVEGPRDYDNKMTLERSLGKSLLYEGENAQPKSLLGTEVDAFYRENKLVGVSRR